MNSIPIRQTGSAFRLKAGARGALIRAFFGSAAMYSAAVLSGARNWPWFAIVTVASLALIACAARTVRATRHLASSGADVVRWKKVRAFYLLNVGLEWALIAAAFVVLPRFGRIDLAPQALGMIVGVHYLPLRSILGARQYSWTGWLLVAASLGSLYIPRGQVRNVAAFVALGSILWVTVVVILSGTFVALRRQRDHAGAESRNMQAPNAEAQG